MSAPFSGGGWVRLPLSSGWGARPFRRRVAVFLHAVSVLFFEQLSHTTALNKVERL